VLVELDDVKNDLLGVLAKLGVPPQGVLMRRVPGFQRLARKYAQQLSDRLNG